jgi:hypothetical protein
VPVNAFKGPNEAIKTDRRPLQTVKEDVPVCIGGKEIETAGFPRLFAPDDARQEGKGQVVIENGQFVTTDQAIRVVPAAIGILEESIEDKHIGCHWPEGERDGAVNGPGGKLGGELPTAKIEPAALTDVGSHFPVRNRAGKFVGYFDEAGLWNGQIELIGQQRGEGFTDQAPKLAARGKLDHQFHFLVVLRLGEDDARFSAT